MRISDWSSDVCSSDLAVIAAHQGDQEAEDGGLPETGDDVLRLAEVPGVLQVHLRIEAELLGRHDVAAEHTDDVGDAHQERQHGEAGAEARGRSEEQTPELQSLMRISHAVFGSTK